MPSAVRNFSTPRASSGEVDGRGMLAAFREEYSAGQIDLRKMHANLFPAYVSRRFVDGEESLGGTARRGQRERDDAARISSPRRARSIARDKFYGEESSTRR